MEQKVKQDTIHIGANIRRIRLSQGIGQTELVRRRIRLSQGIGQTELVRRLQLDGVEMTRETLVKIERGTQHLQAAQLRGIRDALHTTYDELLA